MKRTARNRLVARCKIIPIIKQYGTRNVPTFLQSKYSINLSNTDSFEFYYDELIRKFHGAPLYEKPEIGNNPFTPVKELIIDKTNDEIKEVMIIIVMLFENSTEDYILYSEIVRNLNISRIMTDLILNKMLDQKLIDNKKYGNTHLQLTDEGKYYAIEHKLIK